jgi:hypothetical protein
VPSQCSALVGGQRAGEDGGDEHREDEQRADGAERLLADELPDLLEGGQPGGKVGRRRRDAGQLDVGGHR